jgi:long-chain fatty acid transport protein
MQITKILPLLASAAFAGGIMHNTNQSVDFVRNFAQDASLSNSAVYYNPAGTAFAEDGFYASVNSQTVWQTREIKTDLLGDYEGRSFVPVMPSVLLNWHLGDFAVSGGFFLIGGGGEAKFDDGLPMIDQLISATISAQAAANPALTQMMAAAGISSATDLFSAKFTGKQYVYAWQLGASYRFLEKFSAFLGARINYAYNSYEGEMESKIDNDILNSMLNKTLLDCEQTGWGITPIASLGFHYKKFSAGIKYEHNTSIEMETATEEVDATVAATMPQFADGAKTDNDLPAILSVGASYAWLDWLRTGIGYHHYFDTFASYPNDKQDDLDGDENEFVFGVEADIVNEFTVSAAVQRTLYGITDEYINDLSFVTDSWSVGGGIAFRFNEKFQVQVGYMETIYEEYKKKEASGITKTYDRTSHNIALGLDFKI